MPSELGLPVQEDIKGKNGLQAVIGCSFVLMDSGEFLNNLKKKSKVCEICIVECPLKEQEPDFGQRADQTNTGPISPSSVQISFSKKWLSKAKQSRALFAMVGNWFRQNKNS
ncbi:MAG: hypothetical protein WC100_08685 [Sterolibacterium sp.]